MIKLALSKERGSCLSKLLTNKVLPILVASREPLTPEQIAWACTDDQGNGEMNTGRAMSYSRSTRSMLSVGEGSHILTQVKQVLSPLGILFPSRASTDGQVLIQPYHKSVLDWLTSSEGMDPGIFKVVGSSVAGNHTCLHSKH